MEILPPMRYFSSLSRKVCAVTLAFAFLFAFQTTLSAQSLGQQVGEVFESKQARYKREQELARQQEAERLRMQEQVRRQEQELQELERERRRLTQGANQQSPGNKPASVQIFVIDGCSSCWRAMGFLDASEIDYEVIRVDKSVSAEQLYLQRYGRGPVPVIETPQGISRGYQPAELRRLVKPQSPSSPALNQFPPRAQLPAAARGAATTNRAIPDENNFDVSGSVNPNSTPQTSEEFPPRGAATGSSTGQ